MVVGICEVNQRTTKAEVENAFYQFLCEREFTLTSFEPFHIFFGGGFSLSYRVRQGVDEKGDTALVINPYMEGEFGTFTLEKMLFPCATGSKVAYKAISRMIASDYETLSESLKFHRNYFFQRNPEVIAKGLKNSIAS